MQRILVMALLIMASMVAPALACSDKPVGLFRIGDEALIFAVTGESNWVLTGLVYQPQGDTSWVKKVEDRKVVLNYFSKLVVGTTGQVIAEGETFKLDPECPAGLYSDIVVIPKGMSENLKYYTATVNTLEKVRGWFEDPLKDIKDDGTTTLWFFARNGIVFQEKTIAALKADGFAFDARTVSLRKGTKQYLLLDPSDLFGGRYRNLLITVYVIKKKGKYIVTTMYYDRGLSPSQPNKFVGAKEFEFMP